MFRFRKPYRPYFFGAYSKFFWDIWEFFFYFEGILNDFHAFSYVKNFQKKKIFPTYQP